ncbi:[acyl-carrier-protein] S-malonyltransferase [Streptomyces sp. V4I8]|uniref:acyltransferase domain-containing protein n=1 Tax=Streptomyces sp. V4I8 TaxID=3156469 RepID=UPI003513E98C
MYPTVVHVFPGQGTLSLDALRKALRGQPVLHRAALQVFAEVDAAVEDLGIPPLQQLLWAPAQQNIPASAPAGTDQAALYACCITVHVALCKAGLPPDMLSGVSFGEIPALVAAGVFTVTDGARMAVALARVLPRNIGGMVWLRAGEKDVTRLLAELGDERLALGCVNGPDECVVAGSSASLMVVQQLAERWGMASGRIKLPYYAHHPELAAAAAEFESVARAYPARPPRVPAISATHGRAYRQDEDIHHALSQVITKTAHLPRTIAAICPNNGALLLEAGTGASITRSVPQGVTGICAIAPLADESFPWQSPRQLVSGPAADDAVR